MPSRLRRSACLAAALLLAGGNAYAQEPQRLDPALRFALRTLAGGPPAPGAAPQPAPGRAAPLDPRPSAADVLPGLAAIEPGPAGRPMVGALVRLGPGGEAALLRAGARIGARAGDIVSARIPLDALPALAADPALRRIEAAAALRPIGFTDLEMLVRAHGAPAAGARRRSPFHLAAPALANDIGADEVRVERLRQRSGDQFLGLAGQGVIIGVYDTGLDLAHPDFRDAEGRTRVLFAWDQSAESGTPPGPVGSSVFDYGHECRASTIDAGACPLVDNIGHGTHVAGTAAGTGAATGNGLPAYRYTGVAPAADLIIVKGGDGSFSTDRAVDGVAYVFARAAELGRPAVVVLSLSTQAGPHDGSTAFEQALDALTGPGRIIVAAAGNGGYNGNEQPAFVPTATHAQGRVDAGAAAEHGLLIPPYTPNPGSISDAAALELWYDGADSLAVTVVSPRGDAITVATGDTVVAATPGGAVYIDNASAGPDPANGDHQALIILFDSTEVAPPDTGRWIIRITGDAIHADGTYHLWLTGYSFQNPTRSTRLDPATNAYLVGSPGTASRAITAAAYATRHEWDGPDGERVGFPFREPIGDIAFFSAPGPRRDGVLKPDLAAPGKFTISARARDAQIWRDFPTFVEADGMHAALLGTSQATPHVAGAAAILLQLRPQLGPDEVRALLTDHARRDAFALHPYTGGPDGSPNPQWGHGKLDVERAVHAIGLPAGTLALDVAPLPAPAGVRSARGTRLPLLAVTAAADSVEAIALEQLGFELTGQDTAAALVLIHDLDDDGVAGPGEPMRAQAPVALDGGPRVARFQGPVVPAATRRQYLVLLELSGAAPNGARFSARYLPAETRTRGTLSGAEGRFTGGSQPVDSGERSTSVLEAGERVNLSENPVRGASLTINYDVRPRAAALYGITGRRVRDLGAVLGDASATWDLRNDRGSPVASGAYYLVIEFPGERVIRKIFVVRQ